MCCARSDGHAARARALDRASDEPGRLAVLDDAAQVPEPRVAPLRHADRLLDRHEAPVEQPGSRQLRDEAEEALEDRDLDQDGMIAEHAPRKTFRQAAWQIVVADVSMSLDNVLAVAGAAREHPVVLVFGLGLSIALMGIAASFIARLLQRHHWIAYLGLAVILYVAIEMIYRGALEVWPIVNGG